MNSRNWINVRMRKLLAEDFCPACAKHRMLHDDKACTLRYIKDEDYVPQPLGHLVFQNDGTDPCEYSVGGLGDGLF